MGDRLFHKVDQMENGLVHISGRLLFFFYSFSSKVIDCTPKALDMRNKIAYEYRQNSLGR